MRLGVLLDRMRSAGIVVDDGPVVLSVARDLKVLRVAAGSERQFLRILDGAKGERDFANLAFLRARLGDRINSPTQVIAGGDLVCGVFPYIAHTKVSHQRLVAGGLLGEVATSLALMHAAGLEFAKMSPPPADLVSFTPGTGWPDDSAAPWLRATLQRLGERHTAVAQHCDFTYANLGVSRSGRILIFDWEEFGAVRYPAFDLTTFLLGHYHFGGDIGAALDSPGALIALVKRDFGEEFLRGFGLSDDEYVEAFPAYVFLFWILKLRGFSLAINRRMQAMWLRLRRSGEWARHLGAMTGRPSPVGP